MISHLLARESASPRVSAMFYKATIQTVLLYGSETWVVTDEILQMLTSFHHSVARRLTGRYPRPISNTDDDDWIYPSIKETLRIAGIFHLEEYLNRRKRYLEEYTTEHPQLLQECQNALQTGNTTRRVFWWNQTLTNTDT
jgi:hypothetical protein